MGTRRTKGKRKHVGKRSRDPEEQVKLGDGQEQCVPRYLSSKGSFHSSIEEDERATRKSREDESDLGAGADQLRIHRR